MLGGKKNLKRMTISKSTDVYQEFYYHMKYFLGRRNGLCSVCVLCRVVLGYIFYKLFLGIHHVISFRVLSNPHCGPPTHFSPIFPLSPQRVMNLLIVFPAASYSTFSSLVICSCYSFFLLFYLFSFICSRIIFFVLTLFFFPPWSSD